MWFSSEVWVVSKVCKKWCFTYECVECIVVGELYDREVGFPIILLVIDIMLKIMFNSLVCLFSLSISLWVVCYSKMVVDAHNISECVPKFGCEKLVLV